MYFFARSASRPEGGGVQSRRDPILHATNASPYTRLARSSIPERSSTSTDIAGDNPGAREGLVEESLGDRISREEEPGVARLRESAVEGVGVVVGDRPASALRCPCNR